MNKKFIDNNQSKGCWKRNTSHFVLLEDSYVTRTYWN